MSSEHATTAPAPGRTPFWTPGRYLFAGGVFLAAMGLAGVTGLLAKMSRASFFNPPGWIDWLHLIVGVVAIVASFTLSARIKTIFVLAPAILGTVIGAIGLVFGPTLAQRLHTPPLADPTDHTAHLLVGISALLALHNRKRGERA